MGTSEGYFFKLFKLVHFHALNYAQTMGVRTGWPNILPLELTTMPSHTIEVKGQDWLATHTVLLWACVLPVAEEQRAVKQ